MRENFSQLRKDKVIRFSFLFSSIAYIATTILIVSFYRDFPPYVPIFNSRQWGEERLAASRLFLLFPIIFLLVFVVNYYIGIRVYKKFTLIARLLSITFLLFIALAFIGSLQILLLIF